MRAALLYLVLWACMLLAPAAFAVQVNLTYLGTVGPGEGGTSEGRIALCTLAHAISNYADDGWVEWAVSGTSGSFTPADPPAATAGCSYKKCNIPGCDPLASSTTFNHPSMTVTAYIEPDPVCSQGARYSASGPDIGGTTTCEIDSTHIDKGCFVKWGSSLSPGDSGSWWTIGEGTGGNCAASAAGVSPVAPEDQRPGEQGGENPCVAGTNGAVVCVQRSQPNCGTFNGEYMCVPSIPAAGCTVGANGGRLCTPDAASPPAPDDGVTPGTPTAPDAQVKTPGATPGTGKLAYWFSPSSADASTDKSEINSSFNGDSALAASGNGTGIEEAGTPAANSGAFAGMAGGATADYEAGIGGEATAAGPTYVPILGGGGACNAGEFSGSILGEPFTIDLCPSVNIIRAILEWVFYILTATGLWFIWRGAGKGVG